MSRPITVRLPESARLTLDAVVQQTQRSITWLLTEAIYDAGQAYALDPHALDKYLSADIGVGTCIYTFMFVVYKILIG